MNTTDQIKESVKAVFCKTFPIFTPENFTELTSRNWRKREIVLARYFCYSLVRKYTDLPLISIGNIFGANQDHSTVCHAISVIDNLVRYDKKISKMYSTCMSMVDVNLNDELEVYEKPSKSTFASANYPQRGYLCC